MIFRSLPKQLLLITVCAWLFTACARKTPIAAPPVTPTPAPLSAAPLPENGDKGRETTVRFLENRVRQNPDDFVAYNKLTGYYLQLQRETGSAQYLELAERAMQSSLKVLPPEQNKGGLGLRAQINFAAHRFTESRDDAQLLIKLDPEKGYPYQTQGDALLELGDYEGAAAAFHQSEQLSGVTFGNEVRRARVAALHGDLTATAEHYTNALKLAQDEATPSPETIAWTHWQLGETAFAQGRYAPAEKHYQASLTAFPDYYRGIGGLARARAAQNDIKGAVALYEKLVKRLPDPVYVAALGDLYQLDGQNDQAAAQYALVAQIVKLSTLNGVLYNRQLALFYADHDQQAEAAYQATAQEYAMRRDIYGADALAWTALKAGKLPEAQAAIKDALRLGTKDAKLFYHAGMIARATGDKTASKMYLQKALALSPQFDPLQAQLAQKALKE